MKIAKLEVHTYSPEQNRIFFKNGIYLNVPNCTTIKQARGLLFKQKYNGLICVVTSRYTDKRYSYLDKVVASGRVSSRKHAIDFCKKFKQSGGKLQDSSILPPNYLEYKFYY